MNQVKWKTTEVKKIADCGKLSFLTDSVITPSGRKTEYNYFETKDSVIVVPLRIKNEEEISFIFVEQYRYPIGRNQYEFPAGARELKESNEEAARRELKEETGYEAKTIKFFYSFNPLPSASSFKTAVYVAHIEGEPGETNYDENEKDSGMRTKEFSADQVLKMISDNEITDGKTLAALTTVLLQSPKALEYANSFSHNENDNEEV